ncbi:MAG: hypothetical protein ACREOO_30730 [bacterium]
MPSHSFNRKRKCARRLHRLRHRQSEPPRARRRATIGPARTKGRARKPATATRRRLTLKAYSKTAKSAGGRSLFAKLTALLVLLLATPLAHEVMQKEISRESFRVSASSDAPSSSEAPRHENNPVLEDPRETNLYTFAKQKDLVSSEMSAFHTGIREAGRVHAKLPRLPYGEASLAANVPQPEAFLRSRPQLHWGRFALVQSLTLGIGGYGFQHYNGLFGNVGQAFKIGNDWNKDHTLHFDELLHFQGGYRISQAVSSVYRWAGVSQRAADWIGFGTSALIMTSLEYIDGRRKNDEASYSDLAANFMGMGFALARARASWLQDFDLRLSYRTLADPFRRSTVKRYDRITHWLTYDLNRRWKIPLHLGLGYSVVNARRTDVKSQYYFGVGISPSAVLEKFSPAAAKTLGWLDFYHFGNQVQLNNVAVVSKNGKRKS